MIWATALEDRFDAVLAGLDDLGGLREAIQLSSRSPRGPPSASTRG